jgi:hypothetical protein
LKTFLIYAIPINPSSFDLNGAQSFTQAVFNYGSWPQGTIYVGKIASGVSC